MNHGLGHYGIVLSNNVDKKSFVKQILSHRITGDLSVFNAFRGVLFSDMAIAECIEKEDRYHTIEMASSEDRQLYTFSSGERRKVFLEHCLRQKTDYIIFDNPFDHLDQESRRELLNQIVKISSSISILQLAHREEYLLPFIEKRGFISDNSFTISKAQETSQFNINKPSFSFPTALMKLERSYDKIISFDEVSVSYDGKTVVKDITWQVLQGEFWQLAGPNGSGKSTLLSMITGDNPKAYGQNITILDKKKGSGESIWELKKKIGYFATNLTELFKRNHTVEQMILSGFFDSIGLYVKPSGLQQQRAVFWLDVIKMKDLRNVYFNRLTLGQQRVILIVRALIKQPPLLILDEPFEGLDPENVNLVVHLINTLVELTEITIIYVSHTTEDSLAPSRVYELIPTSEGSIGRLKA